jgi:hypothetical protein
MNRGGGLVATQGDWVYFSRIDENFALYKMRMDGSGLVRLGSNRGCSLSVLGDWIYFVDLDNGNMPYRMRTDGSLKNADCRRFFHLYCRYRRLALL